MVRKIKRRKASTAKLRRRRATLLDDPHLINRRDQFVQILEGAWGEIGWDLWRSRKPEEVRKVMALPGLETTWYRDLLMPFVRASDCKSDPAKMRVVRRRITQLNDRCYKAQQVKQVAAEALQRAQVALSNCSAANHKILKRECKRREQQAKGTDERHAALNEEINNLETELRKLEAAFAQSELLKMVKSRRYSYTPLHLANGMAGLPYIGWRQSALRCSAYPCTIANSLAYTVFRMIQRATETATQKSAAAISAQLKNGIAQIKHRNRAYIQNYLAENWFFLSRAIQTACGQQIHPKALAFRITAAFSKEMRSQSAEDRILADIARLHFSKTANT